ncbi:CvpA family protein [Motiliproteus coralliicola]|uniref:CvpA family protein n=1 Tax=Motiliproteus coralliicola TaxID=2283196 RepID=A0A369WYA7_9GAMM|nr:CvpA family protein [Motiliproteus coralliicola]RDE24475.1 CvpA family protein [Motiliproteus coralliicola]
MNWADLVIIALITVSALLSLKRGFVKEALSLLTWVAAFVIARLFTDQLSVLLVDYIQTPSARIAAAFALLFIGVLFTGALINNLIGMMIKATGLSSTDRVLGMAFGLARGCIVIVVVVALLAMTPAKQDRWWAESTLIPHFQMMEDWTRQVASEASSLIMNLGRE